MANGAFHCHDCIWSEFNFEVGVERTKIEASIHSGEHHHVYRCDAGHVVA